MPSSVLLPWAFTRLHPHVSFPVAGDTVNPVLSKSEVEISERRGVSSLARVDEKLQEQLDLGVYLKAPLASLTLRLAEMAPGRSRDSFSELESSYRETHFSHTNADEPKV